MAVQAIVIIFHNVSVDGSVGMHVRHHMADVAFMSITMMEVTIFTGRGLGSSDEGALYGKGQRCRHGDHDSEPTQQNVRKKAQPWLSRTALFFGRRSLHHVRTKRRYCKNVNFH
jgi:hypothetical protein